MSNKLFGLLISAFSLLHCGDLDTTENTLAAESNGNGTQCDNSWMSLRHKYTECNESCFATYYNELPTALAACKRYCKDSARREIFQCHAPSILELQDHCRSQCNDDDCCSTCNALQNGTADDKPCVFGTKSIVPVAVETVPPLTDRI